MRMPQTLLTGATALACAVLVWVGVTQTVGAQPAAAAEQVGLVVAVRGGAEAINASNERRALALKDPIHRGDTVKTSARGRIQISFKDKTIVSLGRNTEMTIDEYEFEADKSKARMVTRVQEGVFRVMGGAIAKMAPDDFKTVTPTATIGIRGSFYLGSLKNKILTVVFLGGRGITVSNPLGMVAITKVSFGTVVESADKKPAKQRKFAPAIIEALVKDVVIEGKKDDEAGGADGDKAADRKKQEEERKKQEEEKKKQEEEKKKQDEEKPPEEKPPEEKPPEEKPPEEKPPEEKPPEEKPPEQKPPEEPAPPAGQRNDGSGGDTGAQAPTVEVKIVKIERQTRQTTPLRGFAVGAAAPVPARRAATQPVFMNIDVDRLKLDVEVTRTIEVLQRTQGGTILSEETVLDEQAITEVTGELLLGERLSNVGAGWGLDLEAGPLVQATGTTAFTTALSGPDVVAIDRLDNELSTAPAAVQLWDPLTWGDWEVGLGQPGQRDTLWGVEPPDSYWVAGEKAPDTAPLAQQNIQGEYTGGAYCTLLGADVRAEQLFSGVAELEVFFGSGLVNGSLDFSRDNGPMMAMQGMISDTGDDFQGVITNVDGTDTSQSSVAAGGFFGEDSTGVAPAAVGGTFAVDVYPELRYPYEPDSYIGVFGADTDQYAALDIEDMTGTYLGTLSEDDGQRSLLNGVWQGGVGAESREGRVTGTPSVGDNASDFSFEFLTRPVSPSLPYDGWTTVTGNQHERVLDGRPVTVDYTFAYDDLGEVALFWAQGTPLSFATGNGTFAELGVMGIPSAAPTSRTENVHYYKGVGLTSYESASGVKASTGDVDGHVNLHSGKVVGMFTPSDTAHPTVYFYGDTADAFTDPTTGTRTNAGIRFVGASGGGPLVPATAFGVTGAASYASFYGSALQGFGIAGAGDALALDGAQPVAEWDHAGGMLLLADSSESAATGTAGWHGSAVGVSENIADPIADRRLFISGSAEDVVLSLGRDAGTVTGLFSLDELTAVRTGGTIENLHVGLYGQSAYVTDRTFIAELGGTGVVQHGGGYGDLTPAGNYMVPAAADAQLSTRFVWGYWEIGYDEPQTGTVRHLHVPASLWAAGERTDPQALTTLAQTALAGTYSGGAYCVRVGSPTRDQEAFTGTSAFDVYFGTGQIIGTLDFTPNGGPTMGMEGNIEQTGIGFNGQITSVDGTGGGLSSQVTGAFYGEGVLAEHGGVTAPQTVGGTFAVEMLPERAPVPTAYVGVFGADATDFTEPTGPPGTSTSQAMQGMYLGALLDVTDEVRAGDDLWHMDAAAVTAGGVIDGSATEPGGGVFPFAMAAVTADPGGVYDPSAPGTGAASHDLPLLASGAQAVPFSYKYDNLGEFAVFHADRHGFTDGSDAYSFDELGFVGMQSYALPDDGLAIYEGRALIAVGDAAGAGIDSYPGDFRTGVNFHNGAVFGMYSEDAANQAPEDGAGLLFYGRVDGLSVTDVRVLGQAHHGPGTDAARITGQTDLADFYGSAQQGLGISGGGQMVSVVDGANLGAMAFAAGMFKEVAEAAAPTGTAQWHGFAIGVAERVSAPDDQPRVFHNQSSDDFVLNIDRDAGTVDGGMDLYDLDSGLMLSGVTIGGQDVNNVERSAFVDDHALIAEMSGSGVVEPGVRTAPPQDLKQDTSFMASAPREDAMSDWATWGYWAAAYDDPDLVAGSSPDPAYDLHMPAAFWVAGDRTPRSYIESLMNTPQAVGHYSGGARCVEIAAGTGQSELSGNSQFSVFFDTRQVTGSMEFWHSGTGVRNGPDVSMVANGTLNTGGNGFAGGITSVTRAGTPTNSVSSSLQGDFFGPQANAVGGTFSANLPDTTRYVGAFVADDN